ncbi:MAG: VWA domain-containing protein, partial [Thermoplasmata archaeon]|nr:VWA domain-containing protein [Thermoplasmata archaeon]
MKVRNMRTSGGISCRSAGRGIRRGRSGVSEIIATILTLAITVVLFTSLFFWVNALEGPHQAVFSDFEASLENSGSTWWLNISHKGGEDLENFSTQIYIFLNDSVTASIYGLEDGGITDGVWNIGETWSLSMTGLSWDTKLEIQILDTQDSYMVWRGVIGGTLGSVRPLIYEASITPNEVAQGENITLTAKVYDGDGDLSTVYTNLSSIGGPNVFALSDPEGDGVYTRVYSLSLTAPMGMSLIPFFAVDAQSNVYQRVVSVTVLPWEDRAPVIEFQRAIPNPVWENQFFNVSARVTDPQDDLSGVWTVAHPGIPDLSSNRTMDLTDVTPIYRTGFISGTGIQAPQISPAAYSNYTLTVYAEDVYSHYASATFNLTVVNSSTPIITWGISDPTSILRGEAFRLRANVIDQENDVVSVYADLSEMNSSWTNVPLSGSGSSPLWESGDINTTDVGEGDYNITFHAVDAVGHAALPYTIRVRVVNSTPGLEETPPFITSVRILYDPVTAGDNFRVQATVLDINGNLDPNDVKVNLSALGLGTVYMNDTGDNHTFVTGNITSPTPPTLPADYLLVVWANDTLRTDNGSWAYVVLHLVAPAGELTNPDIALVHIFFSDEQPVHSPETEVTVSFEVVNLGGMGGASEVTATFEIWDYGPSGSSLVTTVTNVTVYGVPVRVYPDDTWHPDSGGNHRIVVRLIGSNPAEDAEADPDNNEVERNITVLPSILLVDDDHAPRDGSQWDVVSWMYSALDASGFLDSTDVYTVTGTDGPTFNSGDTPLIDYDILIWMTGYETSNTLTANDRANLQQFLALNRTLWLISEGAMNDPGIVNWVWPTGEHVLRVTAPTTDSGPADPIMGDANHTVTAGLVYNITNRGPYSRGDYLTPEADADVMFRDSNGINAVSYNRSYTTVFFSWEFSKILYPADQTMLVYKVLQWLGGIEVQTGEDIAISQVSVSPQMPSYKDNVTLTATIRNNGASAWSVSVGFYIDDTRLTASDPRVYTSPSGIYKDTVYLVPGAEGDVTITFQADFDPGNHVIRIVADPDNAIEETNELNNEISLDNPIFNLTLYIKYTLLIVDDDGSANNGGTFYNTTANLTSAIDYLGYNYTFYTVAPGTANYPSGPGADYLSKFKAVIWMCGQAATNTLTATDQTVLRDYVNNESGQLWLIGQDILKDLTGGVDGNLSVGSFARDILHVQAVYHDVGTPDPVEGVLYDGITHGMRYQTDDTPFVSAGGSDEGDRIIPTSDAHGIFWQDEDHTRFNALAWEDPSTDARVVFMPWEYAFISGLFERPITVGGGSTRAVIWSDGFETGDYSGGPWTEGGNTGRVEVSNANPHTGTYSVRYRGASTLLGSPKQANIWTEKDLSAYTSATLTFWWTCSGFDSGEFVRLDLSPDGGSTWDNNVRSITGSTGWTQETVDLSGYLTSNMRIRIWFRADSNNEKGYVDDFAIDAGAGGVSITAASVDPDPTDEAGTATLYVTGEAEAGHTVQTIQYWSDVDGTHRTMTPDDGSFDSQTEDAHADVDVSTWPAGMHYFDVVGQDDGGTWGNPLRVYFNVTADSPATLEVVANPNPTDEATTIDISATVSDKWSNIQAAEWWWASDPNIPGSGDQGAGNNNPMVPDDGSFDNTTEIVVASNIDISSIPQGTYRLFVRAQDVNGYWNVTGPSDANTTTFVDVTITTSPPVTSNVQVTPDPTNGATTVHVTADVIDGNSLISEAEAFIDSDPGEGNGYPLTVPSHTLADYPITVYGDISITGLALGDHIMYVRARQQSDGAWGLPDARVFKVTEPDTTGPDALDVQATPNPTSGALTVSLTAVIRDARTTIMAAEYFVGIYGAGGTGTPMYPTDGTFNSNPDNVNVTIDVSSWTYGTYTLYVRGEDAEGNWGPVSSVVLTVSRPPLEERLGAQSELAFMVLKFFEHPEERPELRVVSVDINISGASVGQDVHPMLGGSYLVSAEVYNNGGATVSAVVKLLDGDNIISTQNVLLAAYSRTRVEGIWTPLVVGERNIIVQVVQDSNEVFTFNNIAYRTVRTYFFYDDMEDGPGKWSHSDTVLLINGEGPLDFLDNPINTTIAYNWTRNDFNVTSNTSHSYNISFYAQESVGEMVVSNGSRMPLDVAIVIDTSGSMRKDPDGDGNTKSDDAVAAAQTFIGMLNETDRATIFGFSSEKPQQKLGFRWATGGGKTALNNTIKNLVFQDNTPIWDTIGAAMNYVQSNPRQPGDPNYGTPGEDYLQVVIALTDGDDYGNEGWEDGSETYCPGSEPGSSYLTSTWGRPGGLYWGDPAATFRNQDGSGGHDVRRYTSGWVGYSMQWINLDDESRTGLIHANMRVYTIGLGVRPQASNSSAGGYISNTSADYPFTTEYDLKKIAVTSSQGGGNGEYYYEDTGSGLTSIFQEIFTKVSNGTTGVVSRGSGSRLSGGSRANSTLTIAETETFSLAGVDSATLSFYHKYNLAIGVNGGVVMVGNSTDGTSFLYRYMIPKESYPGNLWLEETEYDDFNRVVRWCYNGVSAGGTFDWEHSEVDLSPFVGSQYVRVRFVYYDYGGGGGGGWWLDDIKVSVTRSDDLNVTTDSWDQWALTSSDSHSGLYSWHNVDPSKGYFKGGLDNSLYTQP